EAMVRYCRTARCRTRMLLTYFGEERSDEYACSHCDNDAKLTDLGYNPDGKVAAPRSPLRGAPSDRADLEPGEEVTHPTFGKGIVLVVEAERAEIDFGGHGVRTVRRDQLAP